MTESPIDFPIVDYLPDILSISDVVDHKTIVTKDRILTLTDKDIERIKVYAILTFGPWMGDGSLRHITDLATNVFNVLQDGDIILTRGDSPFKIVNLINLLYKEGDVYKYNQEDDTKRLIFIFFPLFSARPDEEDCRNIRLDTYLNRKLGNNLPSYRRFVYLDHSVSNETHKSVELSIQRLTKDIQYRLPMINLNEYVRGEGSVPYRQLIINADMYRPTDLDPYDYAITAENVTRCNVSIIILHLTAMGKLDRKLNIKTLTESDFNRYNSKLLSITYYNTKTLALDSGLFSFATDHYLGWGLVPLYGLGSYLPVLTTIALNSIYSITVLPTPHIKWFEHTGKSSTIRLINGYTIVSTVYPHEGGFLVNGSDVIPIGFIVSIT